MSENLIEIQTEDFDLTKLNAWLQQSENSYGALVTFTGVVRDSIAADLEQLFLEHYPGMTEKCLLNIVERARVRWNLGRIAVVHRVGELNINDNIVFVGVISAHRIEAFQASQFIMDYLKKEAPFWKKELTAKSKAWVEQKQSDLDAAGDWEQP
ncbi:MAG: molybdopterin synthase catalytic subunit MoaE [Pseudomonadales bacterium]|nr:molybdopterin synthase catalytic subunit MoaE [Pseudomonadales bacterium]NRA15115.1 molybdopterin synthase catalytic subunit MoaE [Oceanospirillaceae bacterium]